ncbi:DUF6349 family protein [Streptomyces sp. RS10V-4]|uniref:DUF6349 family protein n=1 Tax=Streptomyces rhizoryzae TaxID=2932493 RepID=UPI0020062468|nr:DUF6349 family protein [Streptomyces rhizoryzae]MCK7627270.1 DUF6349 family protein [Streptomyces rhizoryzae]
MTNTTGAIARQRHYTTLRGASREVLRQTWSIGWDDPGYTTQFGTPPNPAPRHTATSLTKVLGDAQWLYRGACLACAWEGPDQPKRDHAIEDAHDHTHPGWRTLPIFDRPPGAKGHKTWLLHVTERYPAGRFDAGGPLRLYAEPYARRHKAGAAPGGGFALYAERPHKATPPETRQLTLE